jgi:hypothetical protein
MHVIDQTDQRLLRRDRRKQAEDRVADQEAIWRVPCAQTECNAQCISLRGGQAFDTVKHRRAKLMQAGKRQLHLRLDAPSTRKLAT